MADVQVLIAKAGPLPIGVSLMIDNEPALISADVFRLTVQY